MLVTMSVGVADDRRGWISVGDRLNAGRRFDRLRVGLG
jgi:hypothetical protein